MEVGFNTFSVSNRRIKGITLSSSVIILGLFIIGIVIWLTANKIREEEEEYYDDGFEDGYDEAYNQIQEERRVPYAS